MAQVRDMFADVLQFHRTMCPEQVREMPDVSGEELRDLRKKLIGEEVDELHEAMAKGDAVEVADALADLLYVVFGTSVAYGIDIRPVWEAVHRANMAKAGGPRREDGKVLKPDGWEPPAVAAILAGQAPIR
ncbi:MazG nucleotide pyrophosphohydrolase domain-containing protein [Singulisphaera sp. PoT]|uniref:MazG nucleotide pyrophosphohydrolase domain-containing protein n=1 Tax=Singulisphaera sp. PoT TaxID=3411797 RepID=UPI003BF4E838